MIEHFPFSSHKLKLSYMGDGCSPHLQYMIIRTLEKRTFLLHVDLLAFNLSVTG